ncbi:MAG: Gfo/Idh/MocA family protein [Limisphaerales bacterium]
MNQVQYPLRIGVIGCGNISYWTHLREIPRVTGARLIAASDPDPTARDRAQRLTKIPIHASSESLLARDDIEAVVIAAPSGLHASLAVNAARSGKHVYLEKPIATTMLEADSVTTAVTQARIKAAVGFNRRCHPAVEQARTLLASGRLGSVRAVQMVFSEPADPTGGTPWRQSRRLGGGVLLDLASHHVDLLRWILGTEITHVAAGVDNHLCEADTAWIALTLAGGITATGYYSSAAGRADRLTFICERGILTVDRFQPRPRMQVSRRFGYGVRQAFVPFSRAGLGWQLRRWWRPSWESSYRRALTQFVTQCQGGESCLATMDDGVKALRVILTAERAAAEGRRLGIDPGAP